VRRSSVAASIARRTPPRTLPAKPCSSHPIFCWSRSHPSFPSSLHRSIPCAGLPLRKGWSAHGLKLLWSYGIFASPRRADCRNSDFDDHDGSRGCPAGGSGLAAARNSNERSPRAAARSTELGVADLAGSAPLGRYGRWTKVRYSPSEFDTQGADSEGSACSPTFGKGPPRREAARPRG